jgi:hypothetical protein
MSSDECFLPAELLEESHILALDNGTACSFRWFIVVESTIRWFIVREKHYWMAADLAE